MPKIEIEKNFYIAILNDVATLIEEMTTECDCDLCEIQRGNTILLINHLRLLDQKEKERIQKHL